MTNTTHPINDERTYEQKQADRKKAFAEKAVKLKAEAIALTEYNAELMRKKFVFGQPILVNHSSEKRHRRDIERSHARMDKVVALNDKADYYEQKSRLVNTAISSDDEQAIPKLKQKLETLERDHERMKRVNAAYRRGTPIEQIDEFSDEEKQNFNDLRARGYDHRPYDSCELSNKRASIVRFKKRLAWLEARQSRATLEPIHKATYTVKEDKADNRIHFLFNGKPASAVRSVLKSAGFKWSPRRQAWIRMRNTNGFSAARSVIKQLDELDACGTALLIPVTEYR